MALKSVLLKAIPPYIVEQANLESYQHLNLDVERFDYYCNELESMGFKQLIDYTAPSIEGIGRVYSCSEHNCYAEVGISANYPVFCSIVSGFEQNWFFAATNHDPPTNTKAIMFILLSLPRSVLKIFNEEPRTLFKSFLSWQAEIENKLSVELIQITDEKMYFAWDKARRKQQRRRLMRKSIFVSLIQMFIFTFNPKSEWMGDYKKSSR